MLEASIPLLTLIIPRKSWALSSPPIFQQDGRDGLTLHFRPSRRREDPTHLPVSLSDGAEERNHPAAVGLCHGGALLQEEPADLQLPAPGRRRQSWRREKSSEGKEQHSPQRFFTSGDRSFCWISQRWCLKRQTDLTTGKTNKENGLNQYSCSSYLSFQFTSKVNSSMKRPRTVTERG